MADAQTLALYDAQAAEYGASFGRDAPSPRLRDFIATLPKGAQVLDLGCGTGNAARHMMDAGIQVDPVDGSTGMMNEALARGLPARLARFDQISGTDCYDGIWANFSLTHAARADLPAHFAALAEALRPGGLLHLGMKSGTSDLRDALGRHYCLVTRPEITGLLTQAGFTVTQVDEGAERGFAGTTDPYLILRATI